MPAWCRPCAKCLRSRRSWGCRPFVLAVLLRRWCSGRRRARPPARLGPHFVRRRASKPARALRSLRRPPRRRRLVADVARCVGSKPGQASPPQPGPLAPSGPSGALHTSGAVSLGVARPGPATAHRHRGQDPRVPRPCPAGQAVWSSETGVAFAGENRSILVRILVAVVMVVSTVAIQGRAVVMGVSC